MELFKLFGTIAVNNDEANEAINETTDNAEKSGGKIKSAFGKIGKAAVAVGKVVATGLVAGATAIAGLTKSAVEAYADYEQLVGGVETLFGAGGKSIEEYAASVGKTVDQVKSEYNNLMTAQDTVMKNAANAYKTAGLSANEYMETVTSFSASLIASVGGDTVKAATIADRAIVDMSDNANKMGTSMELIQNAYNGFAKQNYTMLDNLKLGYGGTQEEMKRLISDASKMTDVQKDLNLEVKDGDMSFANIANAISVVQTKMGITGTTAREAATTISGSVGMMKASWSNLLVGLADDTQDFDQLVNNFVESLVGTVGEGGERVGGVINNILPRVKTALTGISTLISSLAPKIIEFIPGLVSEVVPQLISAARDIINALVAVLPGLVSGLLPSLITGVTDIINALVAALPSIIDAISAIIPMLLDALVSITNALIAALPTLISSLVSFLVTNIPVVLDAAIQLLNALIDAVPIIIGALVPQLPTIVTAIADALIAALPQLLAAAVKLFMAIVQAIPQILSALGAALKALIASIMKPFQPLVNWFKNLWNGIKQTVVNVWNTIKNVISVAIKLIGSVIKAAFNIITIPFRLIWENCKNTVIKVWNKIKTAITTVINAIKTVITTVFNAIKSVITTIFNAIKTVITTVWNGIKNAITTVINAIKNTVTTVFNAIKTAISKPLNAVKNTVTTIFNAIKTAISTPLNAAKTSVSNVFNGIKSTISNVINSAKNIVSSGLNAIKGFFSRLSLKLPKIKLPHFKVTGKLSISPPSVPKLSIDWYAKAMDNAMLLNSATIFGMNNSGQLMGGGEAGQEVVAGSGTLMNMIKSAVQTENSSVVYYLERLNSMLAAYFPEIIDKMDQDIVLDDGTLVGKLAPKMDSKLGDISKLRIRGT